MLRQIVDPGGPDPRLFVVPRVGSARADTSRRSVRRRNTRSVPVHLVPATRYPMPSLLCVCRYVCGKLMELQYSMDKCVWPYSGKGKKFENNLR